MSSTKKQALLVAAVLGLAALAGETRYQYHQERAAIEKSTAFYDCCGLSRLELIKTKAVIRILRENPNPDGTIEDAGRLVRAWSMAVNMTKVDVLRPEVTKMFHGYGIRAERLLRLSKLSRHDLEELERSRCAYRESKTAAYAAACHVAFTGKPIHPGTGRVRTSGGQPRLQA